MNSVTQNNQTASSTFVKYGQTLFGSSQLSWRLNSANADTLRGKHRKQTKTEDSVLFGTFVISDVMHNTGHVPLILCYQNDSL